jgi:type IV secretory pathway VirB10-like protein
VSTVVTDGAFQNFTDTLWHYRISVGLVVILIVLLIVAIKLWYADDETDQEKKVSPDKKASQTGTPAGAQSTPTPTPTSTPAAQPANAQTPTPTPAPAANQPTSVVDQPAPVSLPPANSVSDDVISQAMTTTETLPSITIYFRLLCGDPESLIFGLNIHH